MSASDQDLPYVSRTAFLLGTVCGGSIALASHGFRPLPIYIALIALFHFLEYYITATSQPLKVNPDSFLLNNGSEYLAAHSLALLEFVVELYFFPNLSKRFQTVRWLGLALALAGQLLRTAAMIKAGENFSHVIENSRSNHHTLTTTGIYSFSRHPSYAGFFYWALGTQLLMFNPVSFVLFVVLLYKFFGRRIRYEETTLVTFFGDDYNTYRRRVSTGIPFL